MCDEVKVQVLEPGQNVRKVAGRQRCVQATAYIKMGASSTKHSKQRHTKKNRRRALERAKEQNKGSLGMGRDYTRGSCVPALSSERVQLLLTYEATCFTPLCSRETQPNKIKPQ